MKIGGAELIVVLIVALIVVGPDKLPYYAKNAGKALQSFRKALNETTEEVRGALDETMDEVKDPVKVKDEKKATPEASETVPAENSVVEKDEFDPFAD